MPTMARFDPFCSDFNRPLANSSPVFVSRNVSYRLRPIGDSTPPIQDFMSFRERSKRLRNLDDEKNQLIEDLMYQLETTQQELEQLQIDQARTTSVSREKELRDNELQEKLEQVQDIMNRKPYIVVLIDGNSMIFQKELLSKGASGGDCAANLISGAVGKLISSRFSHLQGIRVKLSIYVNLSALTDKLMGAGMIEKASNFRDFVQGFNSANSLYEIVDAGTQSRHAREKLNENYWLNLYNCNCHQIVLGVSDTEDDYASLFYDGPEELKVADRVTLLESVPFRDYMERLKHDHQTIQFDHVFRDTKLTELHITKPVTKNVPQLPVLARVESTGTIGRSSTTSAASTPLTTWANLAASQPVVAAVPASTRTSTSIENKVPNHSSGSIDRNRLGQRIDKHDTTIPYHEITRIKKMKLCNVYYLQGPSQCPSSSCSHRHDYPLSGSEKKTLREVARMTPCYYKMECEDPDCIYGHRCPQSKPGDNACYYGEDCRFWGWGHGIDTKVVKTTKV